MNNLEADPQTKFRLYCQNRQIDLLTFQGVSLHDLIFVEDLFQINVIVYELADRETKTVCQLIQNSRKIYPKIMKLNVFKNHSSYIFNFAKYCSVFHCSKCDVLWFNEEIIINTLNTATGRSDTAIKEAFFWLTTTIFEELTELDIHVPENDRFYPYFSVFDFECLYSKENLLPTPLSFSMNLLTFLSAALLLRIFWALDFQCAL